MTSPDSASGTAVYLGLGSNLGDRARALGEARERLTAHMTIVRCSPVYETEPVGITDQPLFLNQVVEVRTGLSPGAVVRIALEVEHAMGRRRDAAGAGCGSRDGGGAGAPVAVRAGGPRIIDIDLLIHGSIVVDVPGVRVPHPRLHERAFVLAPLADIAPALVHPTLNVRIAELLARLPEADRRGVRVI